LFSVEICFEIKNKKKPSVMIIFILAKKGIPPDLLMIPISEVGRYGNLVVNLASNYNLVRQLGFYISGVVTWRTVAVERVILFRFSDDA